MEIENCPSVKSLSFPTVDLQSTLKKLTIYDCDNVEVSWLDNNFLSSLEYLNIWKIPNLRFFPQGFLVHLTNLIIDGCDNIETIPDNGYGFFPLFCLRHLDIINCKNLKSFPYKHFQGLASLEKMLIKYCLNLDYSLPCGSWPPRLSSLKIGMLKKPIQEWGLQKFPTSLVTLYLHGGDSRVVSFAKTKEDMRNNTSSSYFLLPSSLTWLAINCFDELESLSEGLQHLTCLQRLHIWLCPKLRDLPETLLPSLSSLILYSCSQELKMKCSSKEGKYQPIISQIPEFYIHSD